MPDKTLAERMELVGSSLLNIPNFSGSGLTCLRAIPDDELQPLEHLTRRLNRLWIHMTARIRFNIPTGTKGPVMNGEALF
jgi:hypothetical protein